MFRMHRELNLILNMAAEKTQEKSTKCKSYLNINCPCNVVLLIKLLGPLNVYIIREINIKLFKAPNDSTKNVPPLDWPEKSLDLNLIENVWRVLKKRHREQYAF